MLRQAALFLAGAATGLVLLPLLPLVAIAAAVRVASRRGQGTIPG